MHPHADVIIVGAGIVGCATALEILRNQPKAKLLLLDKENSLGKHQTGRNSGVIHSGIYYKPGSKKALTCREGARQLKEFCDEEGLPYQVCGKIIVASAENEINQLDELYKRGQANGVVGLKYLHSEQIKDHEPNCWGLKAILVPETGIVDFKDVLKKYVQKIQAAGGRLEFNNKVEGFLQKQALVEVVCENRSWFAKKVICCAGLFSDRLSSLVKNRVRIIPFRGEYFKFKKGAPALVRNLIYPVPNPRFPFLGVHFTRVIGGGIECGPNAVLAFGREAYRKTDYNLLDLWDTVTWPGFHKIVLKYWREGAEELHRSFSKRAFVSALQRLVPSVEAKDLEPAEAGVRAQACFKNGVLADDFYWETDNNVLHVVNAPSPAATASLAIGKTIAHFFTDGSRKFIG